MFFNIVMLVVALYVFYLFVVIWQIPEENYQEFRKFKGNGRGIKIGKNGEINLVKYKTHEDTKRFLSGIRVINLHGN